MRLAAQAPACISAMPPSILPVIVFMCCSATAQRLSFLTYLKPLAGDGQGTGRPINTNVGFCCQCRPCRSKQLNSWSTFPCRCQPSSCCSSSTQQRSHCCIVRRDACGLQHCIEAHHHNHQLDSSTTMVADIFNIAHLLLSGVH